MPNNREQNNILIRLDDNLVHRSHIEIRWPEDMTQEQFDRAVEAFRLQQFGTRISSHHNHTEKTNVND